MLRSGGLTSLTAYSIDDSEEEDDSSKELKKPADADNAIKSIGLLDNHDPDTVSRKRKRSGTACVDDLKLPLPPALKTLFNSSSQQKVMEDDPSVHGGKIRSFAHVRGNWVSFVYIPFHKSETLHKITEILQGSIRSLDDQQQQQPQININEDFHLSLTKTLVFRHHWIDPFIHSVKLKLKTYRPFEVTFNGFEVYVNEEKTRTFIGLEIFPSENLLNLVQDCDECLKDYDLEPYYEDPSFHVSVAWMVGNQENWIRTHLIPTITEKWSDLADSERDLNYYNINCISFKTGNKDYELFL